MKIARQTQTKEHKNSPACLAIEYPLKDKKINGALIRLNGRYPNQGRVVNLKCKEMAYIIKGSGRLVVEGKEVKLTTGDLVLIDPGEKYFWEGSLEMFVPCTPAWHPSQHQEVK